ncbi:MAG: hypothetical protein KatS3mg109_0519 [Pirellulaceae bacterium]|nr:MAG: hypothetical protein KatS3mg109_0519 [Pirellulaceae bacterium]
MRETRTYGSEGGEAQTNGPSLPLLYKPNAPNRRSSHALGPQNLLAALSAEKIFAITSCAVGIRKNRRVLLRLAAIAASNELLPESAVDTSQRCFG